jgi:hypothetical protein
MPFVQGLLSCEGEYYSLVTVNVVKIASAPKIKFFWQIIF